MTRGEFLKALVSVPDGACLDGAYLVVNLLDSIEVGNLPSDIAGKFLDDCIAPYTDLSTVEPAEALKQAEDAALNYRFAGQLVPALTDFCGKTPQIANIMPYEIFRDYYLNPVVANDDSYSFLFPEKSSGWDPDQLRAAVEKGYVRSAEAPGGFLVYLSVRHKSLWVTSRDSIDTELGSVAPDDVAIATYNALGLIHLQQDGQVLVTVALALEEFDAARSVRPTALDGGNARFRVTSDAEEYKGWGYTVRLDRLLPPQNDKNIRGCRETLLDAVDIRPQGDSAWRLLGRIKSCLKRIPDSDKTFLNRLLNKRNMSDVISRLLEKL